MQAIYNVDAAFSIYALEYSRLEDLRLHDQDNFFTPFVTDHSSFFKHCYPDIIIVVNS